MKKQFFSVSVIVAVLMMLSSCGSSYVTRYQVFTVSTISDITRENGGLVYENQICKLIYNFWGNGGNLGFSFFNKTNENLYVDLGESFLIKNDFASPYFKNRTFSYSSTTHIGMNQGASIGGVNSLGFWQTNTANVSENVKNESSVSYTESRIICIPANSYVIISGAGTVVNSLYKDCDLDESGKEPSKIEFNEKNSPLIFRNNISYSFSPDNDYRIINNEFYLSAISNYKESSITKKERIKKCNEKTDTTFNKESSITKKGKTVKKHNKKTNTTFGKEVEVFTIVSPEKFYIPYLKIE